MTSKSLLERFGARLKALREAAGLTGQQVGAYVDRDRTWVYNLEAGRSDTTLVQLGRLAELYGVDEMDLLTFPELGGRHAVSELLRLAPRPAVAAAKQALLQVTERRPAKSAAPAAPQAYLPAGVRARLRRRARRLRH